MQPPAALADVLHAPIEPFDQLLLDTGDGHRLHVEQCGNPRGAPVIVLHGGPASGTSPVQRRFFDPAWQRVVLFDQRGSGRSRPAGSLHANTTAHLVADIEAIRRHLGIERWLVFGGSWGASLGLAYAAAWRERCSALVLRGTFLTGDADLDWFFGGAGALLPAAWQALASEVGLDARPEPPGTGLRLLQRLEQRLLDDRDEAAARTAAAAWIAWEEALSQGWRGVGVAASDPPAPAAAGAGPEPLHKYRIQAHYLRHRCWLGEPQLLRMATTLAGLPTRILHGRLDWVCRPGNALALHDAFAGSTLQWVDAAGHSPFDAPMAAALVRAVLDMQDLQGSVKR